jgi:hypothetical protein
MASIQDTKVAAQQEIQWHLRRARRSLHTVDGEGVRSDPDGDIQYTFTVRPPAGTGYTIVIHLDGTIDDAWEGAE